MADRTKAMRDTPTETMLTELIELLELGGDYAADVFNDIFRDKTSECAREVERNIGRFDKAVEALTAMQAARSEIPVQDDVCRTCQGRGYVWVTPARSRIREREQCSDCTGIPVQDDDAGIIHALKIARKELLREHQGVDFGREARCRVVIERIDEALASIGREAIP